jgi:alginate O-acetyltransferase complex protein AlgI
MIFHSLDYVLFFLLTFALYWASPHRIQNTLLLIGSYVFYGYVHPWFCFLIGFTTTVDFFCAQGIHKYPHRKKTFATISIVSALTVLGFFKYFNFFVDNVSGLLRMLGYDGFTNTLSILLPVGISFYTFQSMSYVIDVYRGRLAPTRSFFDYALFVSFFPQLVAGPIERSTHLLPQVQNKRTFDPHIAQEAVLLIAWGFLKKVVIADNVAIICNKVFALDSPTFPLLWTGVLAFCVQIFADFSAYTDIARGSAKLLGFDLMENFRRPYISRGPSEFWQRWHISLSTWFRDYVYIPLGGSRTSSIRTTINLLATFLLSGLWHGAQWNFVLWGLWWGVLVALGRMLDAVIPRSILGTRWLQPGRILLTFVLINIGWLLFRETNLNYLVKYIRLSPFTTTASDWRVAYFLFLNVLLYSLPIWLHHLAEWIPAGISQRIRENPKTVWILRTLGATICFAGILLLRSPASSDFIYFQF